MYLNNWMLYYCFIMFVIRNYEFLASFLLRGDMVFLIHTGECAFNAAVNAVPFIPLEKNSQELLDL
jgi:hypothetical protein